MKNTKTNGGVLRQRNSQAIIALAIIAVIGLSMAACGKGGDGGGSRVSDRALIGQWYNDEAHTQPYIEFKAGGKCTYAAGYGGGMEVEYKVKGSVIQITTPGIGMKVFDLDDCKIEGNVLTCTTVNFPLTLYRK
jgi:hypothetical protein